MSEGQASRLERLLERTARKFSGGLHPIEVLERVEATCLAAVRDGVMPNQVFVAFNPDDYAAYQGALAGLRSEVDALLSALEVQRGLTRIGDRIIVFESSTAVPAGAPEVRAHFADTAHRLDAPTGATRRIRRHQRRWLVLGDGTRVPFTHTPFSIGRGPGNDLVIASMAISRRHACVVERDGALVIEDLGSRNGITVGGERVSSCPLVEGRVVRLGDIELRIEGDGD